MRPCEKRINTSSCIHFPIELILIVMIRTWPRNSSKFRFRVNNNPPLDPSLRPLNPTNSLEYIFFKILFNIILSSTFFTPQ